MDVLTPKYFQSPIIKLDVVAIIEYQLGVEGRKETQRGKMGHIFIPAIVIHIS